MSQFGSGFAPLATGIAPRFATGFEGLPFGNTSMGMMLQLALRPQMAQLMSGAGMAPFGVGHDQNLYDIMRHIQFTRMQQEALSMAANSDRENFMRSLRGMAAITGTPWGAEQRQAASTLANAAVMASPILAQIAPQALDILGGMRGSGAVMANQMMLAGRYRLDPVTGQMGMTPESVGRQSQMMFRQMFDENYRQMSGMSAGQTGELFRELQMRGMMAGPGGTPQSRATFAVTDVMRSDPGRLASVMRGMGMAPPTAAGGAGISPADLDRLSAVEPISERIRSIDAGRIKRSLQAYIGAVAAMRDIFGDMGRPNAPMQELVAGLEALTQGAMGQMDPARIGRMVRQTYNLATQTGVPLEAALMMQNHAAVRAAQMGIEPIFSVQATQGALAFGGAYRAGGGAAHPAWGLMTSDQLQQLDSNLRVQAASSNMANRLGALMRLSQQIGGFAEGSQAARMVAAVQGGLSTPELMQGDTDFIRAITGSAGRGGRPTGVTEGFIREFVGQRHTNREFVERFQITNLVRMSQNQAEFSPFVAGRLSETLTGELTDRFGNRNAQLRIANAVSGRAAERIMGLSNEVFRDRTQRNAAIAGILGEELPAGALGGMGAGDRQQFLGLVAEQFFGRMNTAIRHSDFRGMENFVTAHAVMNPAALNAAMQQQMRAAQDTRIQEALAPLGQGSFLRRIFHAVQSANPEDAGGVGQIIASAFGVSPREIRGGLVAPVRAMQQTHQQIQTLQRQIAQTADPAARAAMERQLSAMTAQLHTQAGELSQLGATHGLFADNGLDPSDVSAALQASRSLGAMGGQLVGLRGGFGLQVSDAQLAAARAPAFIASFSDAEMAAVLGRTNRDGLRDDELRALILFRRSQLPTSATGQFASAGDERLANRRLLARRLGIDAPADLVSEASIDAAFNRQETAMRHVSASEIADARRHHPDLASDDAARNFVLAQRFATQQERFRSFWGSDSGTETRRLATVSAFRAANAISSLGTRQELQRFGMGGYQTREQLSRVQNRLQTLANQYTGGNLARLQVGHLTLDPRDPASVGKRREVMNEVNALMGERDLTLQQIQQMQARPPKERLNVLSPDAIEALMENIAAERPTAAQGAAGGAGGGVPAGTAAGGAGGAPGNIHITGNLTINAPMTEGNLNATGATLPNVVPS